MRPHTFGNSFDKLRACPVPETGTNGWGARPTGLIRVVLNPFTTLAGGGVAAATPW